MTNNLPVETIALVAELQYSVLVAIEYIAPDMLLRFSFEPGTPDTVLELLGVIHLITSQTLGDEKGFVMGEAVLTTLTDGGLNVLSNLQYRFRGKDNSVLSFPKVNLYHFHLEGDVCLEVVSEGYRLSQRPMAV